MQHYTLTLYGITTWWKVELYRQIDECCSPKELMISWSGSASAFNVASGKRNTAYELEHRSRPWRTRNNLLVESIIQVLPLVVIIFLLLARDMMMTKYRILSIRDVRFQRPRGRMAFPIVAQPTYKKRTSINTTLVLRTGVPQRIRISPSKA